MIIRKFKELINKEKEQKGQLKVEKKVTKPEVNETNSYTGVPAAVYLKEDDWFEPPVYSQKQLDYMVQETEIKRKEREENFSVESTDIHKQMYEIATQTASTTLHIDPPGGSENFHENNWINESN